MTLKLYSGDLSPYSAKVRMQIYAMGIEDDITLEMPEAFLVGRFRDTSPLGRIPVLETPHGLIPESEVIAEYLDETWPDRALLGTTPMQRADIRLLSRLADIYLMNNIFLSLGQMDPKTRSVAVVDLLVGQVRRGLGALEQHLTRQHQGNNGQFAVGDQLSRADCTLVPALWMCSGTVPRLGADNPLPAHPTVAAYWERIQSHPCAARVINEMNRGLKARLDGTEQKARQAALARLRQTENND